MRYILLLFIIIFFIGCSAKSYTRKIDYPDRNITNQYQKIEILKSNNYDYYPYCIDNCYPAPAGMYLQDDLGW